MIKTKSILPEGPQVRDGGKKKPYVKPELQELGSVVELTRGAITAAATDDGRVLHS
jgi:hypothetical protein